MAICTVEPVAGSVLAMLLAVLTGDVFHPDVISVREALPVERKISKGFRRDCAFTTQTFTHTAAGNIP